LLIHFLVYSLVQAKFLQADMFSVTNRYALAKEATLDTREKKNEKESGHMDQPSSSKSHDKKRKVDCSVNMVERPQCNKEYRSRLVNLKASWIASAFSTPRKA
jgi:hypothetical protein